ncbi:MAG: hypothetical protein ACRCVT_11380 [Leadbetterella sp.]
MIGVGFELIASGDSFYTPSFEYELKHNERIFFCSNLGFVLSKKGQNIKDLYKTVNRYMLDLDIKYGVVKVKNHFLKLGLGPSLWVKNDKIPFLPTEIQLLCPPNADCIFPSSAYRFQKNRGIGIGYNLTSELDFQVSKEIKLQFNLDYYKIYNASLDTSDPNFPSVSIGMGVQYRVKY